MNIRFDIEVTPEEVRRLMGLPDVQAFNQQVMDDMMERLRSGAEGMDPLSIFQSSVANNMDFTKQWMNLLSGFKAASSQSGSSGDKS
ncbi:MAG: DUF6489 family protein [Thiolinea sp.]